MSEMYIGIYPFKNWNNEKNPFQHHGLICGYQSIHYNPSGIHVLEGEKYNDESPISKRYAGSYPDASVVSNAIEAIENDWRSDNYHVLWHNCQNFVEALINAINNRIAKI